MNESTSWKCFSCKALNVVGDIYCFGCGKPHWAHLGIDTLTARHIINKLFFPKTEAKDIEKNFQHILTARRN